ACLRSGDRGEKNFSSSAVEFYRRGCSDGHADISVPSVGRCSPVLCSCIGSTKTRFQIQGMASIFGRIIFDVPVANRNSCPPRRLFSCLFPLGPIALGIQFIISIGRCGLRSVAVSLETVLCFL